MNAKFNYLAVALSMVWLSLPVTSMANTTAVKPHPNLMPGPGSGCDGTDLNPWEEFAIRKPVIGVANTKIMGQSSAAAVIGTTAAEIDRKFAGNIEANFERGSTEHLIGNMSDAELAGLASLYQAKAGVASTPLLKTFATRLSDVALVRIARTFNRAAVKSAVTLYSSAAVRTSFAAKVAVAGPMLLPPPGGGGGGGGTGGGGGSAAPTTDMTIEEIYTEFRSAEIGNLSVASALSETAQFAATKITWSATLGYAVGTGISWIIQNYDPSLDDAIGGTISNIFDNASAAGTEFDQGHYESAFDSMFGFPVTNSSSPSGDWGVSDPMLDYYSSGGGCGW